MEEAKLHVKMATTMKDSPFIERRVRVFLSGTGQEIPGLISIKQGGFYGDEKTIVFEVLASAVDFEE
jgi:hypothetical protein